MLVHSVSSSAVTTRNSQTASKAAAKAIVTDTELEGKGDGESEEVAEDSDDESEEVADNLEEADQEEVITENPFSEEQRLKGFYFHQKFNQQFEAYRTSGAITVKKNRQLWDQMMSQTLPEYKLQKAKQKKTIDDTSPEYHRDLNKKNEYGAWLNNARKRYIVARELAKSKRKKSVRLSEEEEYDLLKVKERVDFEKRALYSGKIAKSKSDSGSSRPSGNSGGSPAPGFESTPAPPPPPPPAPGDFYEPDIPPPPPPPMPMPMDGGGFEDSVQPPIFDEPEF